MKNSYLFYLSVFMGWSASAQELATSVGQEIMDVQSAQSYFQTEIEFDHSFKGVQGTPYYDDDWVSGTVKFQTGQWIKGELLYDLVEDKLLLNRRGNVGAVLKKEAISEFQLNELGRFIYLPEEQAYFQVISDGDLKLLARHSKRLRMASSEKAYSTNQDYHQFLSDTKHYLLIGSLDELYKAPSGVSGFTKKFPLFKRKIRDFAHENQLFLKQPDHLQMMVEYINSLLSGKF